MKAKPVGYREMIPALILVLGIALLCPTRVLAVEKTLDVRVSGSANDAEEDPFGIVKLTDTTLDIGGSYRKLGLRFTNIQVPRNAGIIRAYIEFTTAAVDAGDTVFTIEAQAADNPSEFTALPWNIHVRPTYTQTIGWQMNYAWSTVDQVHQTADIKDLVQKLVNRSGWSSGNAMVFILTGNSSVLRRAFSWDADPNKAPKLRIEYTANIIEVPIARSTDDIYQFISTPNNGAVLKMGGSNYIYPGLRFENVDIPEGATINYAAIKFTAKQDRPAETGYFRLRGEKRLNPPTYSTSSSSTDPLTPYYRCTNPAIPKTATYVQWGGHPAWVTDQVYTSPDLKGIIQEIVGQSGWNTSNKSIAIHLYPQGGTISRYAWTYDGDPAKAPVLYVEFGQVDGGGYSYPAAMQLTSSELGRTCFEGSTADSQAFALMNNGGSTLNYAMTLTSPQGTSWITLHPSAATGTIGPGEEQNFSVSFNTSGLKAGTYEAYITFSDPNATPTEVSVRVSLHVLKEGSIRCGDIPLYTQNISSPAVMLFLDLSGSMTWEVDLVDENDVLPLTPNLAPVVQEIVNRDGWQPGNAITFIFDYVSGTGYREARSYDGFNPSKPVFTLTYNDGGGSRTLETAVMRSTDDGDAVTAIPWRATGSSLRIAQNGSGYGAAVRFDGLTIPKGATIEDARIRFVPYKTLSDPITVKIRAHASDNSPTFTTAPTPQLFESQRPRTAAEVLWEMEPWTGVTIEKKVDVAKTVISELVKDNAISWGFGSWANYYAAGYVSSLDYTKIHVGCRPHTAEHQAKIQSVVAGLETYSSTPFSPSLLAGVKYFKGERPDMEYGEYFQEASCQPKFLIQITDGQGNVDSTNENVRERVNLLADAGVSAVGLGFGVPLGEQEQIYAFAETANLRGKAYPDDNLYAMHVEDASGNAIPYLATNKNDLMDAFRTILNNVKGAVYYGSAPAATTSTDLGDMVLLASFNASNWTGDLQALTKDPLTKRWASQLWKASDKVPPKAERSVWTVNASNSLVPYTEDTLAGDNFLCKPIGDIIHSTPVVVGPPPYFYTFDGYGSFKRHHAVTNPRPKMAYVGSNDGLLHAFSLDDGEEKWAFLPRSLQSKLNDAATGEAYNPCSTSYCHRYLLDGSPQVADVYGSFGALSKSWRTILVVGQRSGGTAYTALDVTSGDSPAAANPDPARFLWEFTDTELGQSWSEALIERVAHGTNAAAWGVFFGSGYADNPNQQFTKEAYLFGLEADSGAALWKDGQNKVKLISERRRLDYKEIASAPFVPGEVVTGATSGATAKVVSVVVYEGGAGTLYVTNTAGDFQNNEGLNGNLGHTAKVNGVLQFVEAGQPNNATNSPVAANFNPTDRVEDCIYVGDLYGTMFRVDQIGKGQEPSVSKLFKFNPYPTSPDVNPIRGKATVAYGSEPETLWVYYGTGRYETSADKISNFQQYFFGVKDQKTPRETPLKLSDLASLEARFTTATVGGVTRFVRTIQGTNAAKNSWALKLFAGQPGWGGPSTIGGSERVFTKPLVVGETVFFTTFLPDVDPCGGSGDTYLFALDYRTGLPPTKPVFDLNGDGKFTDADKVLIDGKLVVPVGVYVGRGVGSQPVLFKDTVFVTTSSPQLTGVVGGNESITGLNAFLVNLPQKRIRIESWKHE
ncbi:MAG: PilC/PilY family type IV pilus protein [Desulfobacterales bacterium]